VPHDIFIPIGPPGLPGQGQKGDKGEHGIQVSHHHLLVCNATHERVSHK